MPREAGRIAAEMPVPKLAAVAQSYAFDAKIVLNDHFLMKVYSELLSFHVFIEMPLATSGQNEIKYTMFEATGSKQSTVSSVSSSPDYKYDIIYDASGMLGWVTFDPDTRIMTMPEQLDIANVGLYTYFIDVYAAKRDGNYFTEKNYAQVQVIAGETEEIDLTSNFLEITDADEMAHRVHADYDASELE